MAYYAPGVHSGFRNQRRRSNPPFVPNFLPSYPYYAGTQLITFLDEQSNTFWASSYRAPLRIRAVPANEEYYMGLSRDDDETIIWDERDYVAHSMSNLSAGANSSDHRNQTALSEDTILQHLKTRDFVKVKVADNNIEGPDICIVCQSEYEESDRVGTLCCGHEYHVGCITKWLSQKSICPICKAKALPTVRENQ